MSGAIAEEIMKAIKERNQVRLSLTDCREEQEKGIISYECHETTLRFEPGSDQIKATAYGKHPTHHQPLAYTRLIHFVIFSYYILPFS